MKFIFGIIFIFTFSFCCGQENDFIGKYLCSQKNEFIEIISDSLIKFHVDYPSCLAIPLYGYGKYEIKRGRLFTNTSKSSDYEPNTEIFFKISKDYNNETSLIGPYFRKNLEYRKEKLMMKLHYTKLLLPWKWNIKHCPIDPNRYEKNK